MSVSGTRATVRIRTSRQETGAGARGEHPPIPLIGRGDAIAAVVDLARRGAGVVLVSGPPGVGTTRVAHEAAQAIAGARGAIVSADANEPPCERLARVLDRRLPHDAQGPVVVLLGDVASDGALREAPRVPGMRLIVIATASAPREGVDGVALAPLCDSLSAQLLRTAAPAISEEAIDAVVGLGHGLPGVIVPLARTAEAWVGGDAPLEIPREVVARIMAPLEGLPPTSREIATWAAVLSEPIELRMLVRLSGRAEQSVEQSLDPLLMQGVLEEIDAPGPRSWRFPDELTRAAIEASLAPSERCRRHAAALGAARAAGRPADALVRHAVAATDAEAVVTLSIAASSACRSRGDAAAALAHADRAVAWCPWVSDRRAIDTTVERATALVDLAEWSEASEFLELSAERLLALGDADAAINAWCEASVARYDSGEIGRALSLLTEKALAVCAAEGSAVARCRAYSRAAFLSSAVGRYRVGADCAEIARSAGLGADQREDATRALLFRAHALMSVLDLRGLDDVELALKEARAGAGQRNETLAAICESHLLLPAGRPREAAAAARAGIARAAALGIRDHELVLRMNLAEALAASGDLDVAEAELKFAETGWRDLDQSEPFPSDPAATWLLLARGRFDEALSRYRALTAWSGPGRMPFDHLITVLAGHALAAWQEDERMEARAVVIAGLAAWRATDDTLHVPALFVVGAQVAEPAVASACTDALAQIARLGSPVAAAFTLVAEGHLLDADHRGSGAECYARGARWLEQLGMSWWAARAGMLFGEAVSDRAAAADALLDARQRFEGMGADGWRLRCEAALRRIGRRMPSRAMVRGRGGLTGRETEVVVLVARGLSNKEVAYRLKISEHTVARHLINIFSKLGVATRMAAAEEARARGLIEDRLAEKPAQRPQEDGGRAFLATAPRLLNPTRSVVMAPDGERHHQGP